jgi:ribonuclease VapC
MTRRLIFDSHALLKFFQQEPGAAEVERWLRIAHRRRWVRYLCAINLGEIIYTTKRQFGDERKIAVLAHIHRLNFTILPVPNDLIFEAAEYKAEYAISYADCFVLACAVRYKGDIVTGDPEFRQVKDLARIHWI